MKWIKKLQIVKEDSDESSFYREIKAHEERGYTLIEKDNDSATLMKTTRSTFTLSDIKKYSASKR